MARTPQRAWQRMLSGRRLDLLDPSPLDVELGDIAHGLARVARWNGQTNGDYAFSVAQHSVLVMHLAQAAKPDLDGSGRLYALLHDAPEYVMGDIISPLKAAMGGQYKDLEDRLLNAIHVRFSLAAKAPVATTKLIKKADKAAAYFEAVNLAGFESSEARKIFGEPSMASFDLPGFDQLIRPWPIHEAHEQFVSVFTSILGSGLN
ncbi:hydrolase [Maritalea sp.]|jgi:5'-deoxynucleotidase YfbR-like HD superfamily hydrolase|uniref:hydrolase n=1 Tax=Maritalea sp. TaxID=2003361 RepID=UPI0039E3A396